MLSLNRLLIFVSSLMLFSLSVNAMAETGIFWKATAKNHKTVYLFGSMHSDDPRLSAFSDDTVQAIQSVDVFMIETLQPSTPMPLLTKPKLSEDLTEDEIARVNALTDLYAMPSGLVEHMKPWLLAVIFASPKPQTPFGQDHLLKSTAENAGKKIEGLESIESHFGVLDDVTRAEQLLLLKSVLQRKQHEKEADFEKLLKVYLSGDLDQILVINAKTTSQLVDPSLWEKMKTRLIDHRNDVMASRIIAAAKTQSLFVAAGASHLAGETGLVSQLKEAGFTLKALTGLKPTAP